MCSAIPRERGQQKGPKQGSFDYGRTEPDSKNTFSHRTQCFFRSRNAPTVAQRVPWPIKASKGAVFAVRAGQGLVPLWSPFGRDG